ncbi:cyclin-I-like [Haliotis rufescens]|uniref:cyclin-I-like n=1 Tax=Haliotis rufescens TaxID=6454 RepID=UPI001EB03D56|nr:cyclin-I-like [Haliotis rufescens]
MLLHSGLDARHLVQMLGEALNKEQEQWKPVSYKATSEELSGGQRDEKASWLVFLNSKFHFMPETFNLAVSILDRFLQLVKVRPKYLHCVSVSCFYIAAKTLEEDEMIPSTLDLVRQSECGCSVSEVLRMEAIILNKLGWNPKHVTAINFLHIIHAVLMRHHPHLLDSLIQMTPSSHMTILTRKLFACLCCHHLLAFRPVSLVLALISLEIEQITAAWLPSIILLQKMTKVDSQDLIRCREVVAQFLEHRRQRVTSYKFKPVPVRNKSKKRKVAPSGSDEEEEFYDGFKRLYNEESCSFDKPTSLRGSCGSEMHQDTDGELYPQVQTICAN